MDRVSRDVTVIGGGLAGLTLALQLRQAFSELDVVVLERAEQPAPLGTHKVGESTVEIGAHYLSSQLGLKEHLQHEHLRKYGLRMFFQGPQSNANCDLAAADEIGTSRLLNLPSYQIDRGRLENELAERVRAAGIDLCVGCRVLATELDGECHKVVYSRDGQNHKLRSRWLVDASSRSSPLKRSLGLGMANGHCINSAWFRVAGRVSVDDWSEDVAWKERCSQYPRSNSTNHLMGAGYWVWLIPLSSDMTSIGIVADPQLHPLDEFCDQNTAMEWLKRHEPRCAEALRGSDVLDFRYLRDFSHGCKQVFSEDRWALTGESGVFVDPLYSPGTDFIAISNSYITSLVSKSLRDDRLRRSRLTYEQFYFSFYRSTLALYEGLYAGFGDRDLMALKTTWDFSYYWGVLAFLYFTDGFADEHLILREALGLQHIQQRNETIQQCFRVRARQRIVGPARAAFVDQSAIPCLVDLDASLVREYRGDETVRQLRDNIALLGCLADRIEARVSDLSAPADDRERELLGDLRERLL